MIYFTSDLHFDHNRILQHANRPFETIEEMNEQLIANWNRVVRSKDIVYVLGDFAWFNSRTRTDELLLRLNGHKWLIIGNHDRPGSVQASGWERTLLYYRLKYQTQKLILMHYPILSWHGSHRGSIMVHGHCHGSLNQEVVNMIPGAIIDVGVDVWNYTPVSIETILERAISTERSQPAIDHHVREV